MHKIIKMSLSVGVALVMNMSLAFGMEKEEDQSSVTVPSKLKEPPRLLSPFDFGGHISKYVRGLIVKQAAYEQCLENKSPVNLALVCKEWREIIVDEMQVGQPSWKAWYGVVGYEDIYERFLKGKLIYRPTEGSDAGKIELPIAALTNPLEDTFDLSQCGDIGNYLSISTGYRKVKNPENENKVEIWFAPRFLIEKEIQGAAGHCKDIFPANWEDTAPVGIFWTWGAWDNLTHMEYLTNENMDNLSKVNLYENWKKSTTAGWEGKGKDGPDRGAGRFHVHFVK